MIGMQREGEVEQGIKSSTSGLTSQGPDINQMLVVRWEVESEVWDNTIREFSLELSLACHRLHNSMNTFI